MSNRKRSSITKTKQVKDNEAWVCTQCNSTFINDNCQVMECDGCSQHTCTKCLNMSDEVYKYMNRDDNMWFCGTCLPQLRDYVKKGLVSEWERDATETTTGIRELCEPKENLYDPLIKKIDALETIIKESLNEETLAAKIELAVTTSLRKSLPEDVLEKALKKQTEQLGRVVEEKLVMTTLGDESVEVTGGEKGPWKEVRRKPTNFMETLKEASEAARIESDLQAKRDRNIIIHNVEETGKGTEARSHDEGFVNKLFSDVLDIGTDIIDVARLGRKRDTEGPQKRPLMISLGSNMERLRVMSRLRNLKDAEPCFNRIRVACDLSKEDREQIRKLVQEAKNLTMADETQKWRYIVRGKEIRKVHKRQPGPQTVILSQQEHDVGNPVITG